jgi:hypothetical protein
MKHHTDMMSPTQDGAEERPSRDHGTRFGWDQRIRARGYRIKSRPKHGEPIWENKWLPGVEFTHSEVLLRERLE